MHRQKWNKMTAKVLSLFVLFGLMAFPSDLHAANQPKGNTATVSDYQQTFMVLMESAKSWPTVDKENKLQAVRDVLALYRMRENTAILNAPSFYVSQIDEAARTGAFPLELPLPVLIKIFAVIERDFYNGEDKDELLREVLGDENFQKMKLSEK